MVLNVLEKMHAHLTAAVVSNDPLFVQVSYIVKFFVFCEFWWASLTAERVKYIGYTTFKLEYTLYLPSYLCLQEAVNFLKEVVGNSVNGTTYAGLRARTTGAPQNHWCVKYSIITKK